MELLYHNLVKFKLCHHERHDGLKLLLVFYVSLMDIQHQYNCNEGMNESHKINVFSIDSTTTINDCCHIVISVYKFFMFSNMTEGPDLSLG